MTFRVLFACLGVAAAARLCAHPDLEVALAELNPAIARHPHDSSLLLRRATAYERHEDFALAEADLKRAVELSPTSDEPSLRLAGLLIARDRWPEARAPLARAITLSPKNAEALVWRARLHQHLNETAEAEADYTLALRILPEPPPELFLERAALPVAAEKKLAGLDDGIARLGPAVALLDRAIELELQLGRTDAALARIDLAAASTERKETWLKRRGDILAAAGRRAPAQTAYLSALAEINRLPDWLRESPASLRLSTELQRLVSLTR